MLRLVMVCLASLSLLSCKDKIYVEEIARDKLCTYFSLEINKFKENGKEYKTASPKINNSSRDKTSGFIQTHSYRFDYLITKTFSGLIKNETNFDSNYLSNKFCIAISSDTFYNQIALLANGSKKQAGDKKLTFKIAEVMKIASRFFYCDSISKKDTSISYHICGAINGIDELRSSQNSSAIEAFCFEAIFKSLNKKSKLINIFNNYVVKISKESLPQFLSFKDHLQTVKNKCFATMERDKNLEESILKYYKSNVDNVNFRIE